MKGTEFKGSDEKGFEEQQAILCVKAGLWVRTFWLSKTGFVLEISEINIEEPPNGSTDNGSTRLLVKFLASSIL